MAAKTPAERIAATGLSVTRGNHILMYPEDLSIIDDPGHVLYDPRITWPLSEEKIADFRARGVMVAIKVRENGTDSNGKAILQVIDGRRRALHVRELNRRLVSEGQERQQVKVDLVKGDDAQMLELMIAANAHENESPVSLAYKLHKATQFNIPMARIAAAANMSVVTAERYLAIMDCVPEVQKAFEDGSLALGAVESFRSVPREEQSKVLETIRAAPAPIPVREMEVAVTKARKGETHKAERHRSWGGTAIMAFRDALLKMKEKYSSEEPGNDGARLRIEGALQAVQLILREEVTLTSEIRDARTIVKVGRS